MGKKKKHKVLISLPVAVYATNKLCARPLGNTAECLI